jgi:hypothetical protein
MSPHPKQDFEDRLRALYRRTADEVDTATAARLRASRRRALDAADKPRLARWLMPAGAVAACLLAVVVIWPSTPHQSAHGGSAASAVASTSDTSLPPDPDGSDPGMYQDLGFYAWLADQSGSARTTRHGG